MKILSLKVQNFKTFGPEGIFLSMTALCALIGGNSTGKSNILETLDLFFNFSKSKMSKACFHHNDLSKDIIIEITFCNLSEDERKKFGIHLDEKKEKITGDEKVLGQKTEFFLQPFSLLPMCLLSFWVIF